MPQQPRIAGVMYHDVTDVPAESGFQRRGARSYTLPERTFADHLDLVARTATHPELVTAVRFDSPGRHLLLTFDDGGRSACRIGAALAARDWAGHFFIVTSRIGDRTFVDRAAIRDLRDQGHLVGSHSHTHPDIFRDLAPEAMAREWRTSLDILEDLLGEPCAAASVPGGDISRTVLRTAAGAGVRYLFTSEPVLRPGIVGGCRVLGRYAVKAGMPASTLAALLDHRGWTRAWMVRRLKVATRRALPELYRWYVRQRTVEDLRLASRPER
jgi:peptidoglycan/xylan/chitin deacetylase (PgdA/CDA1 family)